MVDQIIPLYSKECTDLLMKALQNNEIETANQPIQSKYHQPWKPFDTNDNDDDDDDGIDDDDEHSSSSSEQENNNSNNGDDKLMPLSTIPLSHLSQQQQQQQQIRSTTTIGTPPSITFPIDQSTAISIPSALIVPQNCHSAWNLSKTLQTHPVLVILLRSGRLAAAIFNGQTCTAHRVSTKYTVRKGQGKAQSSQDGNRKAKSIGSQLRRQGELALREDLVTLMKDWNTAYKIDTEAGLILTSLPKTMKKNFFLDSGIERNDCRLRTIPLDTGRPAFETVLAVHDIMMKVTVGPKHESEPMIDGDKPSFKHAPPPTPSSASVVATKPAELPNLPKSTPSSAIIPLTKLHELARDGIIVELLTALHTAPDMNASASAGEDFMTPLHYAALNQHHDSTIAAACVTALLQVGRADPCIVDARHRVPYFLATHDKVREAFRMARATLGEDYCAWDDLAKVGPALTVDDLATKKIKAAEKKKRQKVRQRETKAKELALTHEFERQQKAEENRAKRIEETKRARDGLVPKNSSTSGSSLLCDFCQTACQRRNQMLQRLEYAYCSIGCVNQHKRELMAAAAMSRFSVS